MDIFVEATNRMQCIDHFTVQLLGLHIHMSLHVSLVNRKLELFIVLEYTERPR